MPRPKKVQGERSLTPGQASYVLDRLVADRRVTKAEIARYMSEMQNEIGFLERRLQTLRDAAGAVAGAAAGAALATAIAGRRRGRPPASAAAATAGGGVRRRRRTAITAEQKASRQLQGRYLGLIRQIAASKRAQYQRIAKEKGREAAIKEMLSAMGR